MKLPQLKLLAKQNRIRYTCLNKGEIISLLIKNNIITESEFPNNKELIKRGEDNKYEHLKGIRNNPKTVEIFDQQTGETSIYSSTYKVRRALGINPVYIKDGNIWRDRYVVKVYNK